jgi:hypothetical protein
MFSLILKRIEIDTDSTVQKQNKYLFYIYTAYYGLKSIPTMFISISNHNKLVANILHIKIE